MKYDAILVLNDQINEGVYDYGTYDDRSYAKGTSQPTRGFKVSTNWDNPKLYASFSFGNMLRSGLENMGSGYSSKVTDFGKWVVAEVNHHNIITGRTASKTFLIVFSTNKDGYVLSTHNRYRTISGVDQALSYIKSTCSSLPGATQSKIG